MAAVAALFQKTFRDSDRAAPEALEAYFADAYLGHPWYDPDVASRVHVNDAGRVTGFIGIFPSRLALGGETYRAAIAGSLMVEEPEKEPLAGAKLLRSVVRGPQDIAISETTNLVSQRLWEPLGGHVVASMSLDWFRPFRPASAALSVLAERHPAAKLLSPFARIGDWIGGAIVGTELVPAKPSGKVTVDDNPTDADMIAAIDELSQSIALRPAWTASDIAWLLSHAAPKERYGLMRRAVLRSRKGELVGCFLYHGESGGTGRVLQILARPGRVDEIVDCLFDDAQRAGLAGLRGRVTPQIVEPLLTRSCVFLHRASTVIHTARAELMQAIVTGDALMTGLAGESWTRLVGGEFV